MDQAHELMPRYVAFLRAINVGGRTVTNETLRAEFAALGFKQIETFIASGNVIFTSPSDDEEALRARIERRLHKALGYEVHTFLRTDREVAAIARYEAFTSSQVASCRSINVAFLWRPLDAAAHKVMQSLETDVDSFHVNGRELYWLCQVGQGDSKFSNMRFEKLTKVRATFRGIKTIVRLAAKYPPAADGPPARGRTR